jgi:hypothetical protein
VHASRLHQLLLALLVAVVAVLSRPERAPALAFSTNPDVPNLPTLTLNGQAQTLNATMNDFAVSLGVIDASGFNITVAGDSSTGHSAVFKRYCPNATCGTDSLGYVSGGASLPADSLTLNSTGASWSLTSGLSLGKTPTLLCDAGCAIDNASAVKIASQAAGVGVLSTWTTGGWSSTSIALATPTTIRAFSQPGEVYRVDLVWTLGSGP